MTSGPVRGHVGGGLGGRPAEGTSRREPRSGPAGPAPAPASRLRFLDALVPPRLRGHHTEDLLRARFCAAAVLIVMAVAGWSIATSLRYGNHTVAAISATAAGLAATSLVALRAWQSVAVAGQLLTGLVFAYTVGFAWASGGQALAAVYGSGLTVFTGVLFGGPPPRRRRRAASLLALEAAVGAGLPFPVTFPEAHREAIRFRGAVLNVAVMLAASVAYHTLYRRSLAEAEEARRQLLASERRYADLVRHAPLGIVACDERGEVCLVNPRLLRMLGSPRGELEADANLFEEARFARAGVSAIFRRCLDEGSEFSADVTYDSRFGVRVHARVHLAPIRDPEGRITGAQAFVEDVSERQRLEAERERIAARTQEAQRLESLGLLAAGVAHDFNNLLTPILIHAGWLRSEVGANSPLAAALEQIEQAAVRAGELTSQLLTYAGSRHEESKPVHLEEVVGEMARLLRAAAPPGVGIEIALDPDLPAIRGQPTALRQVVLNLVTNACDAIGEGRGRVEIRARRVQLEALPAGSVGGDAFAPGAWVVIEVEDDGCGMDPATRARIFDPFFTTRARGRGLGLAAVLGIVRSHDGFVAIESEPGRGSVFRVFLPLRPAAAAAEEAPAAPGGPSRRREARILVVDDEPAVREAAMRVLRDAGYEVVGAADGEAAIARFREAPDRVDGVVLDLTMPGLDGASVLEELRRIRPDLPVLLSSGFAEPERVGTALELGARGFLPKPYSARDLCRAVEGLFAEGEQPGKAPDPDSGADGPGLAALE